MNMHKKNRAPRQIIFQVPWELAPAWPRAVCASNPRIQEALRLWPGRIRSLFRRCGLLLRFRRAQARRQRRNDCGAVKQPFSENFP